MDFISKENEVLLGPHMLMTGLRVNDAGRRPRNASE
jgi:hypothetical protein